MTPGLVARVVVEEAAYHYDKIFDYLIPKTFDKPIQKGMRVLVPFGRGNNKRLGVIIEICEITELEKLKPIAEVLDKEPLFTDEMIDLALWLKERTFCTLFDALKVQIPSGINLRIVVSYFISPRFDSDNMMEDKTDTEKLLINCLMNAGCAVSKDRLCEILGLTEDATVFEKLVKQGIINRTDEAVRRVGDATIRMARLIISEEDAEEYLTSTAVKNQKRIAVIKLLLEVGSASIKEICYFCGITAVSLKKLERDNIIELFDEETYRNPYKDAEIVNNTEIELTVQQDKAYNELLERYRAGKAAAALLYGITGSGKTQVFIRLIQRAVEDGRGVIVMVPEIALTPQTVRIFKQIFGADVAVLHSGLSLGQRLDEWKRIRNGEVKVAVGTRSAVFAPFSSIGLIIMDEEQEHTYKSESSPRYHAKDVARFRCAQNNALLVLASATPSIESFYAAKTGRYSLHSLTERYGGAELPEVVVVDMKNEQNEGVTGAISRRLANELEANLADGRQSILLLNRRGYNTFISCRDCGTVATCPNCSISLTYHSANGRLMCHYCGYSTETIPVCQKCQSIFVRYAGTGTQKAEQEILDLFPDAKILRMDMDTTMAKFSHEKILKKFKDEKYDILLGTQMVAKGLDFANVTLVGVLMTDQSLYSDDFRSYEKTFSLLTQVVGRSGRGGFSGRAVIQTFTPENPVIDLAAAQDFEKFYDEEISARKALLYPPFCDICEVAFVGQSESETVSSAKYFFDKLKYKSGTVYADIPLVVLGPSPATIGRIGNRFRYRLIIKCKESKNFRKMISEILIEFGKDRVNKNVSAFADMNPVNLM